MMNRISTVWNVVLWLLFTGMVSLLLAAPAVALDAHYDSLFNEVKRQIKDKKHDQVRQMLEDYKFIIKDDGNLSPYDMQFNALMMETFLKNLHPEAIRINGGSLLWHATGAGLTNAMAFLLTKGADVSAMRHDETLICRAALSGNLDSIKLLELECGMAPNDPRARSAWKGACGILKRAAQSGDEKSLKYLYARVGWLVPYGRNHLAVIDNAGMCGHDKTYRYLKQRGWQNRADDVLLRAARSGKLELVRHLIVREGANPHYQGAADFTPVMTAALSGELELVRYLVEEHKVDVNARSRLGDTALLLAARSGSDRVLRYLVSVGAEVEAVSKAGGNVVEQAAASGSPAALRYAMSLLDGKVRKLPQRALCYAARHGHFELVETILNTYRPELDCCIPVSVQHSYPYEDLVGASGVIEVEESSPLIAAIASGNEQLVNFLIEWEADITFSTGEKRHLLTPARAAARRGLPRILKTLLNLDSSGEQDPLLLHQAAQNGHAECVRLLLQLGWDVNAEDPFTKLTPVQAACIRGTEAPGSVAWNYDSGCSHADCVRLLLQAGADVFFDRGRKAKSLALHAENPMFDCAGILWSSGSPLSEEEMLYPLHRAAELGSLSWVEELLPGAKSASVAESHRNPLFTVCNVGDSYLPYLEKHTPSPHRDCAAALQSKGLSIPMDDTRYLIQNGVNRRMYPFLGVEPVRGDRH
ncbi:MAG: hypothetical protein E7032_09575 [Akkermansiaceae bacterium]|nr:hypothetical protein [Akkermansiaceae bacterium]